MEGISLETRQLLDSTKKQPIMSNKSSNSEMNNEGSKDENWNLLIMELDRLYNILDPIQLEYQLIQAAKQADLPLDSFRQMFKEYCRQRNDRATTSWWKIYCLKLERVLERLNQSLSEMDFFKILEYLSKLSILVGVIIFIIEIPQRAEQKVIEKKRAQYEAWQIITAGEKKFASAGRIEALEDLNKADVNLSGLDVEKAILTGIHLPNGDLNFANFSQATLERADFRRANLPKANFNDAKLVEADLREAFLFNANLSGSSLEDADLRDTNLTGANLLNTNLRSAKIMGTQFEGSLYNRKTQFPPNFNPKNKRLYLIEPGVNLQGAYLVGTNLVEVDLSQANLAKANLSQANLADASLFGANLTSTDLKETDITNTDLRKTVGLTTDQVKTAKNWSKAKYNKSFQKQLGLITSE